MSKRISVVLECGVSGSARHSYLLCGWHTVSDIPLTCIPTLVRGSEDVEVLIQLLPGRSPIPKYAGRLLFQHSDGCSFVGVKDIADFEVSKGRKIHVWPAEGVAQKDIEIFLLGPVWAALCHQRGVLPLHASAIMSKGRIIAFAGHRGAGKSTTAALMGSLGYEVLTDDILAVSFNQDLAPGAWPYLRRFKLQGDSITELDLTPTESVSETLDKEKFFVRPKRIANDKWSALERVYLLESDPATSRATLDQITGAEAVRTLIDQTYHFKFILDSGRFREHLALCTQLASKISIYRLRRSPSCDIASEFRSLICEHIESVAT